MKSKKIFVCFIHYTSDNDAAVECSTKYDY